MPEHLSEVHAHVLSGSCVGGLGYMDVLCAACLRLVVEAFAVESDGVVEGLEGRTLEGGEEHCRALGCDQVMAVYFELISARFAAEDLVVFEDQAGALLVAFDKCLGRRQSADSASDDDAVVGLFDHVVVTEGHVVESVAYSVAGGHHRIGVAVRAFVVAYAAVSVPVSGGEAGLGGGYWLGGDVVLPGDVLIHPEEMIWSGGVAGCEGSGRLQEFSAIHDRFLLGSGYPRGGWCS